MIILGKDKIDERFNIDDNGVITDLQGNMQEIYILRGRPMFKGVGVHQIQMYTKNGCKKLDIHHKDENKLNNNINNLQYLTREDHSSLHRKGKQLSEETKKKISAAEKGKRVSEETKKKLSAANKGEKHPMYGKHRSEETKKKLSAAHKGKKPIWTGQHWKLNPETGKRIYY